MPVDARQSTELSARLDYPIGNLVAVVFVADKRLVNTAHHQLAAQEALGCDELVELGLERVDDGDGRHFAFTALLQPLALLVELRLLRAAPTVAMRRASSTRLARQSAGPTGGGRRCNIQCALERLERKLEKRCIMAIPLPAAPCAAGVRLVRTRAERCDATGFSPLSAPRLSGASDRPAGPAHAKEGKSERLGVT
jgi:hypothetical protein